MKTKVIDSHCHLNFPQFKGNLDEIVNRALKAGVSKMLTISTKLSEINDIISISNKYSHIYNSVGVHPHECKNYQDLTVNDNMVTQQVINFNIINGRAVGSIKFVATNNFNPYYYNKEIINLVQFKTPNGVTLLVKENRLRFTQTERDEIINYDENIQENTRITVESFVWEWIDKPAGAFSNKYEIKISEAEPPKPVASGFMGAGVVGAIAGLVLIGFIVDSKVGKK